MVDDGLRFDARAPLARAAELLDAARALTTLADRWSEGRRRRRRRMAGGAPAATT
jgi:hypothetical protein